MRYYSTQRPICPGSYPKPPENRILMIHNYECKTYCEEIGLEVWGFIEYEKPLTTEETNRWELTIDSILWFPVTISSRKHGGGLRITSGKPMRSQQRPSDTSGETAKMQWKTRYFKAAEAERVRSVLRNLDIKTERVRQSVTQGEVRLFLNGKYILNFGDEIKFMKQETEPECYYGENIGGWYSSKPDSAFVLGLFWNPYEHVHHYSEIVCRKLGISQEEWV